MKKALFLSILGFGLVLSTAYFTYQNMQAYMLKSRLPASAKDVRYSDNQLKYLRDLRNLNAEFRKEVEICENDFEKEFGWYMNMETKKRRVFLKRKENLLEILRKLDSFGSEIQTSEQLLQKLSLPIAKSFKHGEVLDAVGYFSLCKSDEREALLGDLLDVGHQKKLVAISLLNYFKKELRSLHYPDYSIDIVGFIGSFENLIGREKIDFYKIQDMMNSYHKYHKSVIANFRKTGYDYDRGGPKFNHQVQADSYEFAKKFQPQVLKLISDLENNSL